MTDGQSASLSWDQRPLFLLVSLIIFWTVTGLLMWGALSDERLQLLLSIASAVFLGLSPAGLTRIALLSFREREREKQGGGDIERHYIGVGSRKQYLWFRMFPGSCH
jgi:hypothetical protein